MLAELKPDIVGFSMSYDVSYPWLKALIAVVREHNTETCIVAGGPAVTTAYAEILADCDLDACCYSEGEVALKELVEADDMQSALCRDPWVRKDKASAKPVYDDLDRIIDVDYALVDVPRLQHEGSIFAFHKVLRVLQAVLHRHVAGLSVQMRVLRRAIVPWRQYALRVGRSRGRACGDAQRPLRALVFSPSTTTRS